MENRCQNYLGVVCINGSCPIANMYEYIERGYDVVRNCDDCHYYGGCDDCYWYRDNQCRIDEMLDDNESSGVSSC